MAMHIPQNAANTTNHSANANESLHSANFLQSPATTRWQFPEAPLHLWTSMSSFTRKLRPTLGCHQCLFNASNLLPATPPQALLDKCGTAPEQKQLMHDCCKNLCLSHHYINKSKTMQLSDIWLRLPAEKLTGPALPKHAQDLTIVGSQC